MLQHAKLVALVTMLFSLTTFAKLTNQSELSILLTGGNTDVNLYNFKTLSKYELKKYTTEFGGHYTIGETGDTKNAKDWDINAKVSRKLSDNFSGFYATKYEHNFFAEISYRFNNDLGASYQLIKNDKTNAKVEAGYRLVEQKLTTGTREKDTFSQARLYGEYSKQQTKDFFAKMWVEYLPNFTDSDDWQLNVEPSLNFAMSSMLSLKVGYLYRYDNVVPTGLKKYDSQYTTTFIAKF